MTSSDDLVGLLPHRPPFRFVDAVDAHVPGESCVARYRVTGDEPFLAGHFPGNPVFPGVLIIEGMAQTAGAIAIAADKTEGQHIVYMVTVDKCKFRRPARPGDVIEYHIRKIRRRSAMGWYEARAMVGETLIAEAEVGAMVMVGDH